MRVEEMTALTRSLRALEAEADRLIPELHREIYSGRLDSGQMFLLGLNSSRSWEKAIDRCREAGVVAHQIVLKNSRGPRDVDPRSGRGQLRSSSSSSTASRHRQFHRRLVATKVSARVAVIPPRS